MKKAINILIIVAITPLILLGAVSVFAPLITFERFGIKPTGIITYSTFRGNIGGTLLSAGLIILIGLITKNKTWFQAAFLMVSVIFTSRIISIIMDGWTNELIPVLTTEIFNFIVLYFAIKQLKTAEK